MTTVTIDVDDTFGDSFSDGIGTVSSLAHFAARSDAGMIVHYTQSDECIAAPCTRRQVFLMVVQYGSLNLPGNN
jgi:hypothetical protein